MWTQENRLHHIFLSQCMGDRLADIEHFMSAFVTAHLICMVIFLTMVSPLWQPSYEHIMQHRTDY